ncbi:MAG: hypothetical protein WCI88_11560, partial [Chloroflexota bacterium]
MSFLSAQSLRIIIWLAISILGLGVLFTLGIGLRALNQSASTLYFRQKNRRVWEAWILIFAAFLFAVFALAIFILREPVVEMNFPPTVTTTPSPTLTQTTTPTLTPYFSPTPTFTLTPQIPPVVGLRFESSVTPDPNAQFSELMFTQTIDENVRPLKPGTNFKNPLNELYAVFHYKAVNKGIQWSAVWLRDGEMVHYETKVWKDPSEGFGYTNWKPESPQGWQPGHYEVQIYIGTEWKKIGSFKVEGDAPTLTPSLTPTQTGTIYPTATRTPTPTHTATATHTPTATRTFTPTVTPSQTLTPTASHTPTLTPSVTSTITPTVTSTFTPSPTDTATPSP